MRRSWRQLLTVLLAVGLAVSLATSQVALAQHAKRETLTDAEIEKVREAGIFPPDRVMLYTKFVAERVEKIKDVAARPRSAARAQKLDELMGDVASLIDELGNNLDLYQERKSDIRKALKPLVEDAPKWVSVVRAVPSEERFDVSRKDVIESGEDLADQVKRLLTEQDDYFATHKDERGQEREDASKEAAQHPQV